MMLSVSHLRTLRRALRYAFCLVSFQLATGAHACIVRHMTKQEALAQTDTTVIARVLQAQPVHVDRFSRSYTYTIDVIRSERGTVPHESPADVEYVLDLAVDVNGSIRCPLQRGSGIEETLASGTVYRMLLNTRAGALFWSEPVAGAKD